MTCAECLQWMRKWIADEVQADQVTVNEGDFLCDHIDELDIVELIMAIEDTFGGEINDPAMPTLDGWENTTVQEMADILYRHVKGQGQEGWGTP